MGPLMGFSLHKHALCHGETPAVTASAVCPLAMLPEQAALQWLLLSRELVMAMPTKLVHPLSSLVPLLRSLEKWPGPLAALVAGPSAPVGSAVEAVAAVEAAAAVVAGAMVRLTEHPAMDSSSPLNVTMLSVAVPRRMQVPLAPLMNSLSGSAHGASG